MLLLVLLQLQALSKPFLLKKLEEFVSKIQIARNGVMTVNVIIGGSDYFDGNTEMNLIV